MRDAVRRYRKRARVCALAILLVSMAAPAAARDGAPAGESEAWDSERAFVELERLRAEIVTLRSLAGAQAALLDWNRERAASGAGPEVLPAHLCAEAALAPWCGALPATFGAGGGVGHAQAEEGER